ncbi:MAG: NDP-sugar synthase [Dehalococcoidales bacterium]|nr:NDP-sugar synthase [Dehalococcoidales bacterium]
MKAVLLIGGEATRLRPLTCNTPKAMVPVLNRPFLENVFRHLSSHGVKEFILTQRNAGASIEDYFGDGSKFGVKLTYIVETTPLGTAGAVKNAEKYVDDAFLVLNGDVYNELDVTAMIAYHRKNKAKATIALTPLENPTAYGLVFTEKNGRVTRFLEKPTPEQATTNMINAGTYILEPEVLSRMPPQTKYSFERQLFPSLLETGWPVYGYPSKGYWIDIGTPEKYLQVHRDLLGKSAEGNVLVGDGSKVHPKARIKGPTAIGENVIIGEGAVIEQSVIWGRVKVEGGVKIRNSVIANDCCIGAESVIEDSVIGDNVTVVKGAVLKPGSKIWPGTKVEA